MDIKTFKTIATKLPPEIAVLMRGPTGVGKSHLAAQCAKELDMPFIDVRGSTMSEGDVGGYPDIEGMKLTSVMTFCMPSWFVRSCREPVVLMLDELNRSLPGVQQSFFQLVLDRELGNDKDGNPYKLHPETRIFAAVNHGTEYDVNDMDAALLRRFWTVDLTPTHQDWITWAEGTDIDDVTVDFIRNHPEHLRVDPSSVEPGTVCPNPASWHRLDASLQHMGMAPSKLAGSASDHLYSLCTGFVGLEASIAFHEFVKSYENVISADDVVAGKVKAKTIKKLSASEVLGVVDKVVAHSAENVWSPKEVKNVTAFIFAAGDEQLIYFWNAISKPTDNGQNANLKSVHKTVGLKVVETIQAARSLSTNR